MAEHRITRRKFLGMAAFAVGSTLAGCARPTPTPQPTKAPVAATTAPTQPPAAATPAPTKPPAPPTVAPKVYKEAPMLAELVKAGKLPPVEQRLPKDPLVVKPVEKIGKYGGTLRGGSVGNQITAWNYAQQVGIMSYNMTGTAYSPNVAKAVTWSPDYKTMTIELREGHKWSDGQPFTVDDILFWWEDVQLNKDLTPSLAALWRPGGKPMEMKKISDTVLQISFSVPYPVVGDQLGRDWFSTDPSFFAPKHYLKKWHKKYNDKADEVAAQEGFKTWMEAFRAHFSPPLRFQEVGRPYIFPWIPEKLGTDRVVLVRNPYFHHVDPEGNQLPYLDRLEIVLSANKEVHVLKAAAGEFDFECWYTDLKDMPVYKQNQAKGNYRILLPVGLQTTICYISFNQTCTDPVLRELFRKKDFRIAMSIGVDRKAINETLFFGLAKPFPAIGHEGMSYFKPEWATMYIQYDPVKANQMLDALGLTKKDGEGYRLRSDGQRLSLLTEVGSQEGAKIQILEMVKEQWRKLGVEMIIKASETAILSERSLANEIICATHHTDRCALFGRPQPNHFGYDNPESVRWGVLWALWFQSGGKQGEEPPEEIKKHKALMDQWRQTLPGTPEFDRIGGEYWKFFAEEIPMIGTVGYAPQPLLVNNKLRNVPEKDIYWTSDVNFYNPYLPTQWYFES